MKSTALKLNPKTPWGIIELGETFNLPSGSTKYVDLDQFIREVRKEELHPEAQRAYTPLFAPGGVHTYVKYTHRLGEITRKGLIQSFKNQIKGIHISPRTPKIEKLSLVSVTCMHAGGYPTHLIRLQNKLHALVALDDFVLFSNGPLSAALACVYPMRNFMVKL